MKNIKDLKENECIHIQTKKDWKKIVPKDSNCYAAFNYCKSIYYRPFKDTYGSLDTTISNNYIIHDAKDFLEETFEVGEEVEVSDTGVFVCATRFYIGKTESGKYVTEDVNGNICIFTYIRKIDFAKNEAIETIKKLAQEHDINLKEIE